MPYCAWAAGWFQSLPWRRRHPDPGGVDDAVAQRGAAPRCAYACSSGGSDRTSKSYRAKSLVGQGRGDRHRGGHRCRHDQVERMRREREAQPIGSVASASSAPASVEPTVPGGVAAAWAVPGRTVASPAPPAATAAERRSTRLEILMSPTGSPSASASTGASPPPEGYAQPAAGPVRTRG